MVFLRSVGGYAPTLAQDRRPEQPIVELRRVVTEVQIRVDRPKPTCLRYQENKNQKQSHKVSDRCVARARIGRLRDSRREQIRNRFTSPDNLNRLAWFSL